MFKSGFVSVIGRPNVGKSTLINHLIGQKVLIVSNKPQTTRNRVQAISTTETAQVIFVDTPGIHRPRRQLGDYMVKTALDTLKEVDLLLFMVEANAPPGNGDRYIAGLLQDIKTPVFLVLNKIDLAPTSFREDLLPLYRQLVEHKQCFTLSALSGQNTASLMDSILQELPQGPLYFPEEMFTDRSQNFIISEIIREKVLYNTREEIPHSVAVEIIDMKAKGENKSDREILSIGAVIYVEKDSQKKIVIGKKGSMLKEIGTEARHELEELLETKIFLDLWVKVKKDWRKRDNVLRQLGYQ